MKTYNVCVDFISEDGAVLYNRTYPIIADSCIRNYDAIIAEIRKQRRRLVRARYELRKERENAKND